MCVVYWLELETDPSKVEIDVSALNFISVGSLLPLVSRVMELFVDVLPYHFMFSCL